MCSVSLVIPCLNESAYIDRLLTSVLAQDLEGIDLQVFIVDGMSNDGSRERIRKWEVLDRRIRLIDNPARVTPVALNLGIKASSSEVVIILGAHAEVHIDFTKKNILALEDHPNAACVGGMIENVHENDASRIISAAMSSPFGVGNARFRTGGKPGKVDTVAFGAYRRTALEKVGYFDERLVRNQDDELNYRLTLAKFEIWFDPGIRSRYYVRGSYSKLARQYQQYGYWKVFVNRLHGTVTTWRQLVPFFFVSSLLITGIVGFFTSIFAFGFAGILALWLVAAGLFSARLVARRGDLFKLVKTFFILHFFYGWGYAKGFLRFLILRAEPNIQNPSLTR